jgi:multimeric flavodoxin WrbA
VSKGPLTTDVLGFVGSPRRGGNTDLLVAEVLAGAESAGATTDVVCLPRLEIADCVGCHVCWRGKPCSRRDDMNELYPRIVAADVLVLGTPVYWYGPTAAMKAFIDRFVYFNCPDTRPHVRGKGAVLAIPYEEEGRETGQAVVDFFARCLAYLDMERLGAVVVGGVGERGDVVRRQDSLKAARSLGRMAAAGDGRSGAGG